MKIETVEWGDGIGMGLGLVYIMWFTFRRRISDRTSSTSAAMNYENALSLQSFNVAL